MDSSKYKAKRTIDAGGALVHPGFIDNHVHLNYHSLRWLVRDGSDWNEALPIHAKYMANIDSESEKMSTSLAMLEMVKNGTTSFLEAGGIIGTDGVAEAANHIGMRAFLGDSFVRDISSGETSTVRHDKIELIKPWVKNWLEIIKKMDFPEWIDRPHIDQNIITELENILLNSSLVLKKWLNPRTEKEKLFFNEIEGVILAEKPNSIK